MPQQNYLDELTPAFTPLLAIKEASRCLLCHDAPCSQACPAQTDLNQQQKSLLFLGRAAGWDLIIRVAWIVLPCTEYVHESCRYEQLLRL